jgi:hypothetical protein
VCSGVVGSAWYCGLPGHIANGPVALVSLGVVVQQQETGILDTVASSGHPCVGPLLGRYRHPLPYHWREIGLAYAVHTIVDSAAGLCRRPIISRPPAAT